MAIEARSKTHARSTTRLDSFSRFWNEVIQQPFDSSWRSQWKWHAMKNVSEHTPSMGPWNAGCHCWCDGRKPGEQKAAAGCCSQKRKKKVVSKKQCINFCSHFLPFDDDQRQNLTSVWTWWKQTKQLWWLTCNNKNNTCMFNTQCQCCLTLDQKCTNFLGAHNFFSMTAASCSWIMWTDEQASKQMLFLGHFLQSWLNQKDSCFFLQS